MRSNSIPATPVHALSRATLPVRRQLEEVSARVAAQSAAFDPAIEGYVSYALDSNGKQLRPLVVLLAGGATGEITPAHVDLAVIIELIHLASLVHDDIMDEAERRRGLPTLNARWGNALSVLLGDSLFAHALELSTKFDNANISRAIARATRDVCTGEIIQTQRRFDLHMAIEEYFRVIELKTATLFAVAGDLGATLNSAPRDQVEALCGFGRQVGSAYQIYDDCIDVSGREQTAGKTLGSDLRKGKMTLPMLRLLRNAPAIEKERLSQMILESDTDAIAELLGSSGALAFNESIDAGLECARAATTNLANLPASSAREALSAFADGIAAMLETLRRRDA